MSNRFRATVYLSLFISKQCIIKQLLDSVFVISGIIKRNLDFLETERRLADDHDDPEGRY